MRKGEMHASGKEGHNMDTREGTRMLILGGRLCGIGCVSGKAAGFGYKFEGEGDDIGMRKQDGGVKAAASEGGILQYSDVVEKTRACVCVSAAYR
jgi:hypothetical protein